MSVNDIYILATTQFTSSAIQFRDELRGYQGVINTTPGIDEWTGSTVNYLHVGSWYFSASFSQSKATKTHSQPQTVGYEVMCDQGRNFKTLKYVDKAAYESILDTNYWLTSPFLNPITASIKKTRGVNLTHTQSPNPPGPSR